MVNATDGGIFKYQPIFAYVNPQTGYFYFSSEAVTEMTLYSVTKYDFVFPFLRVNFVGKQCFLYLTNTKVVWKNIAIIFSSSMKYL